MNNGKDNKLKILIADDDKDIQLLYEEGLPSDRYEKRIVGNGNDVLKLYKSWHPDIIVLDITMPIMSGYQALGKIKELESTGDIKKRAVIIMATAMSDEDDIMDCIKLGIHGYIVKPFSYKKISNQILDYFHKNELR